MEKKRHSRLLTIKTIVLFVVLAAALVIIAIVLSNMQTSFYLDRFTTEMEEELDSLPDRLEQAQAESDENDVTFDSTYEALAESVAFLANNDPNFAVTDEKMVEYRDLLGVDNVLIVSTSGEILAQAQPTLADFSNNRFNRLREEDPFLPNEVSVEIDQPSRNWRERYFSAKINSESMVVIAQDPALLYEILDSTSSTASVLQNIEVGLNGYILAMSAQDYLIEYHPDASLIDTDGLYAGVEVENLEDGEFSWMTINNEYMYCGVKLIGNTYYIACVPQSDMTLARNVTVLVTICAFFAVMFILIMYGIFAMREIRFKGVEEDNVRFFNRFCFVKSAMRRSVAVSCVGFAVIVVIAFFMQTLFALSFESLSNKDQANDVIDSFNNAEEHLELMNNLYGDRYLPVAQTLGYILDEVPNLDNQANLQQLADTLGVQDIFIYESTNGDLVATNSSYNNYALSLDPEDSSYEFIKLIQGDTDYVVQEPVYDEVSGHLWQYIGVPIHDENGFVSGIVQITIRPSLLESLASSVELDTILGDVSFGDNGFAFAVNKDDDTFAYFPIDEHAVGESVYDHDITYEQLKPDYNDYITIDDVRYYASSAETDQYYIYLAEPEDTLMQHRLPLTLATALIALIAVVVIFLLEILEPKSIVTLLDTAEDTGDRIVETEMPDGRKIRTESAVSRWMSTTIKWDERTPWQKTTAVMRWIVFILVAVICIAVLFRNQLFNSDSIFLYILGGSWERGLNIFAITACVMFICVAMTIVVVLRRLLQFLSNVLNARGETICRLCRSFLRYGALIGMIYYCLTLIGINAVTLLASAGILALAISLGAQRLVSDIVSGLFVIFEGDFRVGDIIQVGDWRGTVLEIGIRTTKVEDASQNVKIIRNSDISNVVNMTKKLSFVSVNYGIEYNESLEHVESILSKELPEMAKRLPAIKKGPFYRGVTELGDNSVDLKITMQCEEADRFQLERDFNREMRLLFDKYDINIPFPQVVINEPTVQKKASSYEKWLAQQFAEEQKEASKEMGKSEDGDHS
ncbi:MAG: mechanosensitive ion channel [Lachnospiraceae bacterium]|nr:mechanosensitive ion channel [Lachnospiraceae bacterium]